MPGVKNELMLKDLTPLYLLGDKLYQGKIINHGD